MIHTYLHDNFVVFANPKGLLIGPDVAPYFADKRNPLYNADVYKRQAHTTIVLYVCTNVRRTGYRHSVDNVKRSVVTREGTCTTDGDL